MNCKYIFENKEYTFDELKVLIKSKYKEEFKKNGFSEYSSYIARVSLGIIKNPSSGEYNYESQVKDIVYHGTNLNFDKFDKTKIGGNTAVKGEKPSFSFSNNKQQAEAYSSEITVGQNTNELAEAWFEENQHVFKNGDINTGIIDINNVFDYYKKELGDSKEMISPTKEIDPVTNKYKLVPVNDKNLKELSEIKTKERQQEYNTLLTAGARVMSAILNIKSPKIVDFKGEKKSVKFKEEQLSTKGDGFIAKNIDDWGKGDVIQVFEPEQIHILGSKQDIQGFKDFVQGKQVKEQTDNIYLHEDYLNNSNILNAPFIPPTHNQLNLLKQLDNKSVKEVLEFVISNTQREDLKYVAEVYLKNVNKIHFVKFKSTPISGLKGGHYDAGKAEILFNPLIALTDTQIIERSGFEKALGVILHEFSHTFTIDALFKPKNKEEVEFKNFITEQFKYYKQITPFKDNYGFKNEREFISEILTNRDFRSDLYYRENKKEIKNNYLKNILDKILKFLGFKTNNVKEESPVEIINTILSFVNDYSKPNEYTKSGIIANNIEFQKLTAEEKAKTIEELFESNPELASISTPEQYSQYLDTILPDSKVEEIDNSLYISVLNQLEQENIIEKDCSGGGKLKAEKGLQTNFTKGGKWKIYEIFEGKSHKQGGIDINIKNNQISFTNKNGSIKAKYGLVISKKINYE